MAGGGRPQQRRDPPAMRHQHRQSQRPHNDICSIPRAVPSRPILMVKSAVRTGCDDTFGLSSIDSKPEPTPTTTNTRLTAAWSRPYLSPVKTEHSPRDTPTNAMRIRQVIFFCARVRGVEV